MQSLRLDIRYALRSLRNSPAYSLTALLTLGVGIGAGTSIFSFVDNLLLRPLAYPDADHVVSIWQDYSATGGPETEWFTPPDFDDLRNGAATLEAVSLVTDWRPNLTGSGEPEQLSGAFVSADYFRVAGIPAAIGRTLQPEDESVNANVVVLSDALWRRRFGADRSIVGQTIDLLGAPYTVVGVMPADFQPPLLPAALWRPAGTDLFSGCGRGCYTIRVVARVRPDVSVEAATTEVTAIGDGIRQAFPAEKEGMRFNVIPLQEQIVGPVRPALLALFGAVGMLILIGCVNLANLMVARANARQREMAVRVAIGAGRGSLAMQLATEAAVLGLAGGVLGSLIAVWGTDLLIALSPPGTPRLAEVSVDARILGFALALTVLTTALFALLPCLTMTRPGLGSVLRSGAGTDAGTAGRTRSALVVAEVALSIALLAGAGLLMRSFLRLQAVDPGFDASNALAVDMLLPSSRYPDAVQYNQFYDDLLARLDSRSDVTAAGASSIVPLSGDNTDVGFLIEGRPLPQTQSEASAAWYRSVTPDYFRAMGMRLIEGRSLEAGDREGTQEVVVINETMRRRYWPEGDAIGSRLTTSGAVARGEVEDPNEGWVTVVGVVADVHHVALDQPPLAEMYLPYRQLPARFMTLVVRTTRDAGALIPELRAEVAGLDDQVPLANARTLEQAVSRSVALPRLALSFFVFFAAVALLLAAIGIYGVTAYAVGRRTREIGVRVALGARSTDVAALIMRQAMTRVALGAAIGLASAFALSGLLQSMLYDLSASDPWTFAATTAILLAVALAAGWLPARKASRLDPQTALRAE